MAMSAYGICGQAKTALFSAHCRCIAAVRGLPDVRAPIAPHLCNGPDPVLAPRQLAQAQERGHRQAAQVLCNCRQRDLPTQAHSFCTCARYGGPHCPKPCTVHP